MKCLSIKPFISLLIAMTLSVGANAQAVPADTGSKMSRQSARDPASAGKPRTFIEEKMPQFSSDLNDFIARNLHYPKRSRRQGHKGRVVLRFVINAQGFVQDVSIQRSCGFDELDAEAVRLLRLMKDHQYWLPGIQNGKPVSVVYTLPIIFSLDEQKQ